MASSVNRVAAPSITNECVWDGLAQSLRRVTVQIFGRGGNHGAGIVWRSDGMIVTNAHVVRGTSMIRLEDGRTHRAELVAQDHRLDLAILRIPVRALEGAQRRDSTLRTGEVVVAVGHPLGDIGAVSFGIVHAAPSRHLIEADIRLLPGNSGGPLADASGRVVGIHCMVANGMAVAVSTAAIERFLQKHLGSEEWTA